MIKGLFAVLMAGTLMIPHITPALGNETPVAKRSLHDSRLNSDRESACAPTKSCGSIHKAVIQHQNECAAFCRPSWLIHCR